MHWSAKNKSLKCVLGLIARGANIDPRDKDKKTPLMVAIEASSLKVSKSLIELGSEIEAKD